MSNLEITRSLGLSAGTVKLHIHAIPRLTGTRTRTETALTAGRSLPLGSTRPSSPRRWPMH